MFNYRKWDKKEAINGVAARTILASHPRFNNASVYLIFNDDMPNRILRIEEIEVLRANGGHSADTPDDYVLRTFIEQITTPAPPAETSETELAIMEALAAIYEQNLEILNK